MVTIVGLYDDTMGGTNIFLKDIVKTTFSKAMIGQILDWERLWTFVALEVCDEWGSNRIPR